MSVQCGKDRSATYRTTDCSNSIFLSERSKLSVRLADRPPALTWRPPAALRWIFIDDLTWRTPPANQRSLPCAYPVATRWGRMDRVSQSVSSHSALLISTAFITPTI